MASQLTYGTLFAGRYRVERLIGQGGMGAVYEAIHLDTDRRRALKVMHPHTLQSVNMRERFKREAKVAAHVESEHIVDVFDAGVDDVTGSPFLVMELLRGEELGRRVKRVGKLPPAEAISYLYQSALALEMTHRASIVHRDIKPANLFLHQRADGAAKIKVLDFGVAKLIADSAAEGATTALGTPLYMAPEQFDPNARLTGAADIYALGMVAFTLLVGRPYWADEARDAGVFALAAVAMYGPKDPASVRAAVRGVQLPHAFDAWFACVTARDPSARFSTAIDAVRALAEALSVQPLGIVTVQLWETSGPPAGDRAEAPTLLPASRTAPNSPRAPEDRMNPIAETTMWPAVQPTERTGVERTPMSRKQVRLGALGALSVGMAIAIGYNFLVPGAPLRGAAGDLPRVTPVPTSSAPAPAAHVIDIPAARQDRDVLGDERARLAGPSPRVVTAASAPGATAMPTAPPAAAASASARPAPSSTLPDAGARPARAGASSATRPNAKAKLAPPSPPRPQKVYSRE